MHWVLNVVICYFFYLMHMHKQRGFSFICNLKLELLELYCAAELRNQEIIAYSTFGRVRTSYIISIDSIPCMHRTINIKSLFILKSISSFHQTVQTELV